MKTHPTPDQWMSFLYGEGNLVHRQELDAHLRDCPDCAVKVKSWRAGMSALDKWKLPRARVAQPSPALRWAAAAAVLVLGVVLGRFSMGKEMERQIGALRAEIRLAAAESAGAETQRVLGDFAKELEDRRGADASAFLAALKQVDARRGSEFARLRRDLDTVAVFADARLSHAQEQLSQLASYAQASPTQPDDK